MTQKNGLLSEWIMLPYFLVFTRPVSCPAAIHTGQSFPFNVALQTPNPDPEGNSEGGVWVSVVKIFLIFLLALVIKDLFAYFVLDRARQYQDLRAMIAAMLSRHRDFLIAKDPVKDPLEVAAAKEALAKASSEIDRFITILNPFLIWTPSREKLKDAVYCMMGIAKDHPQKRDLVRKLEHIFGLPPSQIN